MLLKTIRYLAAFSAIALTSPAFAQAEAACTDCLSQQEARDDLATLYETLQREHVDMFARQSRADYAAHIEQLTQQIDGTITKPAFNRIVQDAMAFGRIGHGKTEAVLGDVIGHIQQGGKIIPLSIAYRGDTMLSDNWADRGDEFVPGSKITGLGGLSLKQFEDRLRPLIAADTDRLLRAQLELGMPAYVFLVFGAVEELEVEFETPGGESGSRMIPALGYGEMFALQGERAVPRPPRNPGERIYRELGNGIFYLQPGPFYASEEERGEGGEAYAIEGYKAFVEEAFAALTASGAEDLIIDLRNNPGGDASFSDLVIARLVDQPYRFSSRYEIRAGENTKRIWADRDGGDPATLSGLIASSIASAQPGERVAITLPLVEPIADHAFSGRVFALVNKHSYSNAAVVAALLQDLDIATLMGEETADLATTYGAVETFSLPNSGTPITYPKAYMVRPSGSEAVRGVVPDFLIGPNPIGQSDDVMLDTAIAQILVTR